MNEAIAATNGHLEVPGPKTKLAEADALTGLQAANDQLRAAQKAYDTAVADQVAKDAAHEAAKVEVDRKAADLERAEDTARAWRSALKRAK